MASTGSKKMYYAGWVVSALPILFMLGGGIFALLKPEMMAEGMTKYGYPASALKVIPILEVVCALIYAIPRTSVLGAILLTGYLGGAVATHVRAGEPIWWLPVAFGVIVWLGLYLRDERLRALVPLRSS